jgi:hypothetical protein
MKAFGLLLALLSLAARDQQCPQPVASARPSPNAAPGPAPSPFDEKAYSADMADWREDQCGEQGNRTVQSITPTTAQLRATIQRGDWKAAGRDLDYGIAPPRMLTRHQAEQLQRIRLSLDLIAASARGDIPAMRELVAKGADVAYNAEWGDTMGPLAWAARCNRVDAIQFLLDSGAEVDQPFNWTHDDDAFYTNTALTLATARTSEGAVKALLAAGADPNVHALYWALGDPKRVVGETAVANETSLAIIRILLDAGADPEAADAFGETPMMVAVRENNLPKIEMLLCAGANPSKKNNQGETAESLARRLKFSGIVTALRSVEQPRCLVPVA